MLPRPGPGFIGRTPRFAYELLQRFDEPLDLFFGVVRGEAGPDEPATLPYAELLGERRGVEVTRRDEETVFQHPRADFVRRVSVYPEGDGGSLADAFRGGVELYSGEVP